MPFVHRGPRFIIYYIPNPLIDLALRSSAFLKLAHIICISTRPSCLLIFIQHPTQHPFNVTTSSTTPRFSQPNHRSTLNPNFLCGHYQKSIPIDSTPLLHVYHHPHPCISSHPRIRLASIRIYLASCLAVLRITQLFLCTIIDASRPCVLFLITFLTSPSRSPVDSVDRDIVFSHCASLARVCISQRNTTPCLWDYPSFLPPFFLTLPLSSFILPSSLPPSVFLPSFDRSIGAFEGRRRDPR